VWTIRRGYRKKKGIPRKQRQRGFRAGGACSKERRQNFFLEKVNSSEDVDPVFRKNTGRPPSSNKNKASSASLNGICLLYASAVLSVEPGKKSPWGENRSKVVEGILLIRGSNCASNKDSRERRVGEPAQRGGG